MKRLSIVTAFSPPHRGAVVTRIVSLQKYIETHGWQVDIWADKRFCLGYDNVPDNVRYFLGWLALLKGLLRRLPDVVMVTSPPGDTAYYGTFVGRLLLRPVIYDIRDPWTLAQVALGGINIASRRYRRQIKMERRALSLAGRCSVVTGFLRDMMCGYFKIDTNKFVIAPNGVVSSDFRKDEAAGKEVRRSLGIPGNAFVIVYEGIAGGKELDKFLLHCGRLIAEKGGHILFVVIEDKWSQDIVDNLKTIVSDLGITENFHLVNDVVYSEMYRYLSASDIGLNPLPSKLDYCLPIKTFEYMACELPVISKASQAGVLADIHRKYAIGPFASDWNGFQDNLKNILSGKLSFKEIGHANRIIAEKYFDRRIGNQVFLQELERLIQ